MVFPQACADWATSPPKQGKHSRLQAFASRRSSTTEAVEALGPRFFSSSSVQSCAELRGGRTVEMIWDASDANPMHRRLPAEAQGR